MKDIFSKIGDSIKNTCKEAVDQTQKTVDQTKYRTELINLKNELKKLHERLGQAHYTAFISEDKDNVFAPLCNRITAVQQEIERLENKIKGVVGDQKNSFNSFKDQVKNTWQEETAAYTDTRDENGIKILKFCEHCNVGNPREAAYCINCGKAFQ